MKIVSVLWSKKEFVNYLINPNIIICFSALGSAKVGEQEGLISSALSCILDIPSHLQIEHRFDLLVLVSEDCYHICS